MDGGFDGAKKKIDAAEVSWHAWRLAAGICLCPHMSLAHIRPWFSKPARCSSRVLCSSNGARALRFMSSTAEETPLETPEDWTKFQLKRADYRSLSALALQ